MRVAVIGSRSICVNDLGLYLPQNTSEIVSGGAKGVDTCAKKYAVINNIKLKEFLPDYKSYGRGAPLRRNIDIINYSDIVIAFWDGKSRGTNYVINKCKEHHKKLIVYLYNGEQNRFKEILFDCRV